MTRIVKVLNRTFTAAAGKVEAGGWYGADEQDEGEAVGECT